MRNLNDAVIREKGLVILALTNESARWSSIACCEFSFPMDRRFSLSSKANSPIFLNISSSIWDLSIWLISNVVVCPRVIWFSDS